MSMLAEVNSCPLPSQLDTSHLQVERSHIHTILSPDVQIPPQAGLKAQPTPAQFCGFQGAAWLCGAWIKQMWDYV